MVDRGERGDRVMTGVSFRVLGEFGAEVGGVPVKLGGPRQRAVLAMMLCARRGVVSLDRLVDGLWGERPPPSATTSLRAYVSRLRRLLEPERRPGDPAAVVVGVSPGYALRVGDDAVDAWRFERLLADARSLAPAEPARAFDRLASALGQWRGPAYPEVADQHWAVPECARLDELRLAARLLKVRLGLRLGAQVDAVVDAQSLVDAHPLSEEAWRLLVVALWSAGRQADALAALRRCRTTLTDEIGLDPGPELCRIETAILTGDSATLADAAGWPEPPVEDPTSAWVRAVPAQLPAPVAAFAGRRDLLERLDALADQAGGARTVVAVLSGPAGVGKTALAVHWGQRVADRFPDGQLFADLRGFDPDITPTAPGTVLRGFLSALHVPPDQVPVEFEAQAALFRSLLNGRRMLIVLDNAREAAQVRPLLPGTPGCLVVVTSRSQLRGLVVGDSAHPVRVGLPTADEARELLAGRLGRDRVETEIDAVDQIIEVSGRLPLALAILAARATTDHRPRLGTLTALWRGGLDELRTGDPMTDVRSVFAGSYGALRPPAARLFRWLGLHPGGCVTAPAAASLAGVPPSSVPELLTELTDAHLLTEQPAGRYRQHDLLRAYAVELAQRTDPFGERRAATRRLLDHYLHTAHAAARLLRHQGVEQLTPAVPGVSPEELDTAERAADWLAAEHRTLVAMVDFAARSRFDTHAWQLAASVGRLINRRGYWHDGAAVHRLAVAAAERLGDPSAQASARLGLARSFVWLHHDDAAREQFRLALDLYRSLADRSGAASVQLNLHWMATRQGDHRAALACAHRARELFRLAGDHAGEGNALNAAGWSHARLGELQLAAGHCRRAVAVLEGQADVRGLAQALDSLGYVQHRLGRHGAAAAHYQRAVHLHEQVDDRFPGAETLVKLGDVLAATGDRAGASTAWRRALDVHDELGLPQAAQIRERLARPPDQAVHTGG